VAAVTTELSSLARYVPRLSAEWELRTSEPWREIDGTLCYIDISGFTALSEKLARRGRIGAEELTEVLNYVFGKMLGVAYERGGSLLKFGGDALLLVFQGTDHPIQACSAAVEMQAVLREARSYETSAGRLHLKMSVGLHSGTVHLFRVGDSHKELILTGPAASMTTEMEETAVAGQVLISSATKAALPTGSATKPKGDGWLLSWRKARIECCGWSPRVDLEPEAIAAGMPLVLREYLQYGKAEPEHRIATVGFIKYHGVDALMEEGGPSAVAAALDELIRNVQEAVDEEGVTFLASDIDQDGGKIILVAGVPGAQEDDEGRVLRAARRIADRSGTLRLRIGVNQGHVFVGEIGTDFRATYTIMGDTVNLAARLMASASPGELYASPSVLDRSQTIFETTALEPFYVKGKEHPVQAYAVGGETGSRTTERSGDLPFAGRVEEVVRLSKAIESLKGGSGGVVTVIGDTGIGKSRLVDEVLPLLEGTHHFDIRSEPYGTASPYRVLRDPVRHVLGVERADHSSMANSLRAAVKKLTPELVPLVPLVADVAMVEVVSTPEADAIEAKFRQDRTADVLIEIFAAALREPVLFEVEDGHWMDDASSHVLERLAAASSDHPWLVLTTRRDEVGGFSPAGDELHLGPLSNEEARALVVQATKAAPLRSHDLEAIIERAGGLPLFLEEIVRSVRQAGAVESLPDSLDAVVSAQIDGLEPLARRLLRYASVLGRSFRVDTLNDLLADEEVALDAATRRQLAGYLDPDGSRRLHFRHAVLRDAAYAGLSFRRRRELHQRAGESIERAAGSDTDTVADLLALHYSRAGDHEKTWRYARIAGDQAREAYANVEAAQDYERALEASRRLREVSPNERAEVLALLGDVREAAGVFDDALAAYRRATQLLEGDPLRRADLQVKKARTLERAGRYGQALGEITRGVRLVKDINGKPAAAATARLAALAATIRVAQQKDREAIKQALIAVEEAREAGERAALARAYSVLDLSYRWIGEADKAVYAQDALAIYEDLNDLAGVAVVTSNLGVAAYFDGNWVEALDYYERGRDAFLRSGNTVQAALAESAMGEIMVNQGRVDEAEPLLEDADRVLRASGFVDGAAFAEVQLGRLYSARGDLEASRDYLERARQAFMELGETASVIDTAVHLAELQLKADDPTGTLALIDEAEGLSGGEAAVHSPSMLRIRADALKELGRLDEAERVVTGALDDAESQGLPYEIALLLTTQNAIIDLRGLAPDEAARQRASGILSGLGVVDNPEATRSPS
jgi:class 3 adenylate cyclase/predicted ATPase